MQLRDHRYGKARVRLLKILREQDRHSIVEIEVKAMFQGDFESSYTAGDNSKVVPTDTIKNTVNVLARKSLTRQIEPFGLVLAEHFLGKYPQVGLCRIEIAQRDWRRMAIDQSLHPHSFLLGGEARRITSVSQKRGGDTEITSGIRDLVMLKSTGSGFAGYPKDDLTTLPETDDRILATSFSATWLYSSPPLDFGQTNDRIVAAMLKVFAQNYSPSAQTTLFRMGSAALALQPEISRIELIMPNKHYLPVNLAPFGLDNNSEVFTPTEEPHGQIEVTMIRDT
jgi:urate oxidase